jgi:hypothetical protein
MQVWYYGGEGREIRTRPGNARFSHTDAAKLVQGQLDKRAPAHLEHSFVLPHARAAAASQHESLCATAQDSFLTANHLCSIRKNPFAHPR